MNKIKFAVTALAAVVGLGSAVAAHGKRQAIAYKQMDNGDFHRVINYDDAECSGLPTVCIYLIDDGDKPRDVIPGTEDPSRQAVGEQSYQGEVAGGS